MIWLWLGFIALVLGMLALDLGVFHKKSHVVGFKEAMTWTGVWVAAALGFAVFVYWGYENQWMGLGASPDPVDGAANDGRMALIKYLTGYVVEKSLSIDNVFVIALLFGFFAVPALYQHRVLFWGIIGALLMRGAMIAAGAALIQRFHWILYLFGIFLILTALKMLFIKSDETDPNKNIIVRLTRKIFRVTSKFHGEHFFVRAGTNAAMESETPGAPIERDMALEGARAGSLFITPLMLALIMVETTDLIFAVDSIPAIFAITGDPFLVFTSNVFAMLGLRSLYFALAGMLGKFRYLKVSLAVVLMIVGAKMLAASWLKETFGKNFVFYLLAVILLVLFTGALASWLVDRREKKTA